MNKNLKNLVELNPKVKLTEYDDSTKLTLPWNDKTVGFVFKKGQKLIDIKDVIFPEQLSAIYNYKDTALEFIYGPISQENKIKVREFDFLYKGQSFKCSFGAISDTLKILAKAFKEQATESQTDYRNIRLLRDVLNDGLYKELFKDKFMASFFVQGNFKKINFDFVGLSKSLNFYMSYFDRNTPTILIHPKELDEENYNNPCLYELFDTFPKKINASKIDSTLLDTFMVAGKTENIRLQFIFYFQVLEYCSYYYLDKKIQAKILKTMNDPSVFDKPEYFSKTLIEDLKDHFSKKDDSIKLEKTITENVSIKDLKNEIESNKEFFSNDIEFEGGLKINRIVQNDHGIDSLKDDDLILIKKNIERIRNVLVHLRESRENKVILPSQNNNQKLQPYLWLIRRIAEKVAINF